MLFTTLIVQNSDHRDRRDRVLPMEIVKTRMRTSTVDIDLGGYQLGWHDENVALAFEPRKGLDESVVRDISAIKEEPEWMLDFRLKAYQRFLAKPIPCLLYTSPSPRDGL